MAGRRRKTGAEEFLDFLAESPWWMGLVCAAAVFVFLWFVVPAIARAGPSPDEVAGRVGTPILILISKGIAWPVAVIVALAGLFAKSVRFLVGPDEPQKRRDRPRRAGRGRSAPPGCPLCNAPMVRKTARRGRHAGEPFWGCSRYPGCTGKRAVDT